MVSHDDILGRTGKFVADRRKIDPSLDQAYIQYETPLAGTAAADGKGTLADGMYSPKYVPSGFQLARTNVSFAIRELKEHQPTAYKVFFPRVYHGVDNYNWRWANYASAMHIILALSDPTYVESYDSQRNATLFSAIWEESGLNQFFVTPALYDAVANTDPPADIAFNDFQMPHEAMVFQLPTGKLTYNGHSVPYIGICRLRSGKYESKGRTAVVKVDIEADKFLFTTAIPDASIHFGIGAFGAGLKQILEGGVDVLAFSDDATDGQTNDPTKKKITPDVVLVNQMMRIALNLILAMEVEPELLERGRKVSMHKKESYREVWQPNFIGRKYRIVYSKPGVAPGTHASPRMHWRSGHFRRQGVGTRKPIACLCGHLDRSHADGEYGSRYCMQPDCNCFKYRQVGGGYDDHRTVWIKPILVNAKQAAQ